LPFSLALLLPSHVSAFNLALVLLLTSLLLSCTLSLSSHLSSSLLPLGHQECINYISSPLAMPCLLLLLALSLPSCIDAFNLLLALLFGFLAALFCFLLTLDCCFFLLVVMHGLVLLSTGNTVFAALPLALLLPSCIGVSTLPLALLFDFFAALCCLLHSHVRTLLLSFAQWDAMYLSGTSDQYFAALCLLLITSVHCFYSLNLHYHNVTLPLQYQPCKYHINNHSPNYHGPL